MKKWCGSHRYHTQQELINTLNSGYIKPFFCNCFPRLCWMLCVPKTAARVSKDLKKAECIAIRDFYMSLTVHYINSDLTMSPLQITFCPESLEEKRLQRDWGRFSAACKAGLSALIDWTFACQTMWRPHCVNKPNYFNTQVYLLTIHVN